MVHEARPFCAVQDSVVKGQCQRHDRADDYLFVSHKGFPEGLQRTENGHLRVKDDGRGISSPNGANITDGEGSTPDVLQNRCSGPLPFG